MTEEDRTLAETAVLENAKWADAVIWAMGAVSGVVVLLKLTGAKQFKWQDVTLSTDQAWIVLLLLSVGHIYAGVLLIRSLRAYWPKSTTDQRHMLFAKISATGGILVRGMVARTEFDEESFVRIEYRMHPSDPTAWAALVGLSLMLGAIVPFRIDREALVLAYASLFIAQANWIMGSHWLLALSDLKTEGRTSAYFERTSGAGIRVLMMGSGGLTFAPVSWLALPLWMFFNCAVFLSYVPIGIIVMTLNGITWGITRIRERRR